MFTIYFKRLLLTLCLLTSCLILGPLYAKTLIVAAENIYGNVAKQIGGEFVTVMSIINTPTQDPHLFNVTPSTARAIADAGLVVYNGADYDPWMKPLLAINKKKPDQVLIVAELIHHVPGDNPHIWYAPFTVLTYAKTLTTLLSQQDPMHQAFFAARYKQFNEGYQDIFNIITQLKVKFKDTPVIATEPLFNDMAEALGLHMHAKDFQIHIMNDVPPTISQIKQFEDDLHQHAVKVLIYNNQVSNPLTQRLLALAKQENIPTVGVSEMMPNELTYVQWMLNELRSLEKALNISYGKHDASSNE